MSADRFEDHHGPANLADGAFAAEMAGAHGSVGDWLRRQVRFVAGWVLVAFAGFVALSLLGWDVADPSLSHATEAPVTNWMGYPGAVTADLAMQFFGLAALAALVPLVAWAVALIRDQVPNRAGRRMAAWFAGALCAAAAIGCLPPTAGWPLPSGREAQPSLINDSVGFELPPLHLLSDAPATGQKALSPQALERNAGLLEGVLEDFRVTGEVINVCPGPVVTLYEFEPAPGVKSARVIGLADDIARSMSAISARVAVIPGRNAIGIELPNNTRETVYLSEILASQNFEKAKGNLPLAMGKTIGGEPVIADLARMPHLLVAGTTGSGKSVAINTMILSILYRWTPEECRLILIDPKMLELSVYDGIPHLLTPVVTDPGKAVVALKWAVKEMEDRYRKMSKLGVRNIDGFNARVKEARRRAK
jgi:DNA segregation ATPase FtsK/SpoIIIE-like protein